MRGIRQATNKILEMIDEGVLTADQVARACLSFMSEDDVAAMGRREELMPACCSECDEYLTADEDECGDGVCEACQDWLVDDSNDGQPDEAQKWHDFDPDC